MRLLIIIIASFLLPWTVGIVFIRDKKIVTIIAPFSSMVAYVLNTIGIDLGLFYPLPVEHLKTHTVSIFANIGILPVLSCLFIYFVTRTKIKPIVLNIAISIISTLIDSIFISAKYLEYAHGWDFLHSLLFYNISFCMIYLYYLWLKKINIFKIVPE